MKQPVTFELIQSVASNTLGNLSEFCFLLGSAIVQSIVKNHINDFEDFYAVILSRAHAWK